MSKISTSVVPSDKCQIKHAVGADDVGESILVPVSRSDKTCRHSCGDNGQEAASLVISQQHRIADAHHYVQPSVVVEVGCNRIALGSAEVDYLGRPKHARRVWLEVIDRVGAVVGDDDFAASVLVEIRQQRVSRAESDKDYDLRLEGPVPVADEDRDTVVVLRSVCVHDVEFSVSVDIANPYARRIAARRVHDTGQEGPIALIHAHTDGVARAENRGDEVRPAITVEVARLHVSWDVVTPILDLGSVLEGAAGLAVKDERPVLV